MKESFTMRTPLLTAAALLALLPSSALAVTIRFAVAPLPSFGPGYTFNFLLDSEAIPNFVTSDTTRFNGTPLTYTRPGSSVPLFEIGMFDGPTFFRTINQGGIALLRLDREPDPQFRLFGTQLFTGALNDPDFTFGTFDLSSTPRNGGDPVQPLTYRITISNASAIAAVPEPATWAMMILGFGAVGGVLRHRASRSRAGIA